MGHAGSGTDGMGEMMSGLVRAAFRDAVQSALVVAVVAAVVAAVVVSLALSTRLSRPISRLAEASQRIAAGRYAERVETTTGDEIGELADSFNTMAASLEATERRRLELVGDVAHELRTPLTTIDGYLEGSTGRRHRAGRGHMDAAATARRAAWPASWTTSRSSGGPRPGSCP